MPSDPRIKILYPELVVEYYAFKVNNEKLLLLT